MGRTVQEIMSEYPLERQLRIQVRSRELVAEEEARRQNPQTQVVFKPCPGHTNLDEDEDLGAEFYLRHPSDLKDIPAHHKVLVTLPLVDNKAVWEAALALGVLQPYWPTIALDELPEQIKRFGNGEYLSIPG